jgi:hypothetical protein
MTRHVYFNLGAPRISSGAASARPYSFFRSASDMSLVGTAQTETSSLSGVMNVLRARLSVRGYT